MKNEYYTLGKTGLRVSRLCLGTMTFGTETKWGADKAISEEMFNKYFDAGGNFYDTANIYTAGTSEKFLGEFVNKRKLRDKVVLASKFTFNTNREDPNKVNPNAGGNGRKNIYAALEATLKRMNTDYLDLYIAHCWDQITPVEELISTFNDLVKSGKVRYIGFSDMPAWVASRAQTIAEQKGYERLSSIQLEYSLLGRNIENEYVDMALDLGMGITAWSPLAGGVLSGKYSVENSRLVGDGRLKVMREKKDPTTEHFENLPLLESVLNELKSVANALGKPMAAVALNWVANKPGVASVIIGARDKKQLEANLSALDFEIPEELMLRLNKASQPKIEFPYSFFHGRFQKAIHGNNTIGQHHSRFYRAKTIDKA